MIKSYFKYIYEELVIDEELIQKLNYDKLHNNI